MKRLGFTPQRPLYRAWQQDPALVEQWREEAFPKIAARAKREKALIFFADESGLRSDHHAGTSWSPKGQTPIVKATGARFSLNMLSAVNALGHFRFMTVEGRVTATVFRDFLKRLITGMERKIFLIVDGHPTHKAKLVRSFVETHDDRIELFFLPPYSPELNPDELVWNVIKGQVSGQTVVEDKQTLRRLVRGALRRLQRSTEKLKKLFHEPNVAYILDECRV